MKVVECYVSCGMLTTNWSRVVIAHQIRNRSTKTFQAITALRTQRRWCLTGTPVQNKLDDLFSLTAFLQFYPVDNDSNTRRYILEPLGRKDPDVLAHLRSIMTTVALRRTPVADPQRRRSERVEPVLLYPAEREQYREILSQAKKMLAASTRSTPSSILFTSLLRLRQICSHGTCQIDSSVPMKKLLCYQCGDLISTPNLSTEIRMFQQARLCYDCDLAASGSTSDPTSRHPSVVQSGFGTDCLTTEIGSGIDTIPSSYNIANISMGQEEPISRTIGKSSKLEKVLSNLINLQQVFNNSQDPIKR